MLVSPCGGGIWDLFLTGSGPDILSPLGIWFWMTHTNPWAAIQGIALLLAAAIAWHQIGSLRREQKNWETLKACERYESDQVITQCLIALRAARRDNKLTAEPIQYSLEMSTILNYLEGIAIGVEQGFYNRKIVRDHLETIMVKHVGEFLGPPLRAVMLEGNPDYYSSLEEILKSWKKRRRTYFRT